VSDLVKLVSLALLEDMPKGDITTDALKCEKKKGQAQLVAKQDLMLSGCSTFAAVFKKTDPKTKIKWRFKDGAFVSKGEVICELLGNLAGLLKGERTALNFLGHLSGIATVTSRFVEKTKGTKCKITDTRKTTPGLRRLEKDAVVHGGGTNHRLNLSDGILIKENHIRAAGCITACVDLLRKKRPKMPIEVEVTGLDEIKEALACKVERVLLDNMDNETTKKAVELIAGRCLIEASGNMTLDRIESVAKLGVDFISVGQITHSAPSADVSLLFER
jgi:nicotinate-nucleotide pyrophosphorylase (carboxylating)